MTLHSTLLTNSNGKVQNLAHIVLQSRTQTSNFIYSQAINHIMLETNYSLGHLIKTTSKQRSFPINLGLGLFSRAAQPPNQKSSSLELISQLGKMPKPTPKYA